jgi:hypothetical protein
MGLKALVAGRKIVINTRKVHIIAQKKKKECVDISNKK